MLLPLSLYFCITIYVVVSIIVCCCLQLLTGGDCKTGGGTEVIAGHQIQILEINCSILHRKGDNRIYCRFFTLFAIAGTLLGSILCFLEGTFFVMESYFQYFHSDHSHIMQSLIESLGE